MRPLDGKERRAHLSAARGRGFGRGALACCRRCSAQRFFPAAEVATQDTISPSCRNTMKPTSSAPNTISWVPLNSRSSLQHQDEERGPQHGADDRSEPADDDHGLLDDHLEEIEGLRRDEAEQAGVEAPAAPA